MVEPADQVAEPVCPFLGGVELGCKRHSLISQFLYAGPPGGRSRSQGQLRGTGCEPFHLLQLDAIPGWVADDGIKASFRVDVLPMAPHPWKGRLPMQEVFPAGNGAGSVPQRLKPGQMGFSLTGRCDIDSFRAIGEKLVGLVWNPTDGFDQLGCLECHALFLFHSCRQPPETAKEIEQAAQFRSHLINTLEKLG